MAGEINIKIDPIGRHDYLLYKSQEKGFESLQEYPDLVYLPMSMNSVPANLRPIIRNRIEIVKNQVLIPTDLKIFDPAESGYSPERHKSTSEEEVTKFDLSKIVQSRYLVMLHLIPSTGSGIEMQWGADWNKVVVELLDNNVAVSRMKAWPYGIRLGYDDLSSQSPRLKDVFKMLQEYEIGSGEIGGVYRLLGFKGENVCVLENRIWEEFPEFKFVRDPNAEPVKTICINPKIFYENRQS